MLRFRSFSWGVALLVTGVVVATAARAEAPPPELPLIENKLHPMGFRFEVSPLYTYSLNDKYTHHTGFTLALAFHVFDFLGIEAYGGYNLNGFGELNSVSGWPSALRSGWTNLTEAVNAFTHSTDAPDFLRQKALELPDLYYQTWNAGANVVFSPFYGKWSIVSELDGSFYFYGIAGAGAAGTAKEDWQTPGQIVQGPVVVPLHYGVGTRIFFTKWLALRAEIRDYWWINPEVEEHDQSGADPCPGGYCLTVEGQRQQFVDFSRMTMVQAGVSFIF